MGEDVALVIPGRNVASVIRRCLGALIEDGFERRPAEIIFVDDASTDETARVVAEFPVRYLKAEGKGPAAARNIGWRAASTPLIWFIDADCVAEPDALARLLPHMGDRRVAGVGGSYGNMRPDSLLACLIHHEITERHAAMPKSVNFLGTFNVLYRREGLERVTGFDEGILTGEDADLAFRIHKAGYKLRFERESRVRHFHPVHLGRYLRTQRGHGYWRARLYARHPDKLHGDSYSGLLDHIQPVLAMLVLASMPLLLLPFRWWIPAALLGLLALTQFPMTWRILRRTRDLRMTSFAGMSLIRAFWRGLGMTGGVLRALSDRSARHAPPTQSVMEPRMTFRDCLARIDASVEQVVPDDPILADWVRGYAAGHRQRLAHDLLMIRSTTRKGARILEFGSSPPILTLALHELGYDVHGLDIAPERFASVVSTHRLTIHAVDFESRPAPFPDGMFDVVLFNEVFEHLRINPIFTMSEVKRVMRPEGVLLLSTPNLRSLRGLWALTCRHAGSHAACDLFDEYDKISRYGHMGHVREYTPREVTRFLDRVGLVTEKTVYRFYDPPPTSSPRTRICLGAERILGSILPTLRPQFAVVCTKRTLPSGEFNVSFDTVASRLNENKTTAAQAACEAGR